MLLDPGWGSSLIVTTITTFHAMHEFLHGSRGVRCVEGVWEWESDLAVAVFELVQRVLLLYALTEEPGGQT